MAYIGKEPLAGNFVKLDAITTSATATYALTRSSVAFKPANAESLLVSLNGVTQAPLDAYTVNDTNIVFASALTSSDTIDYILALGEIGAVTTPADSTVDTNKLTTGAVTAAKLATDSVTTIKIADDAVTGAKIENNPTIAGNLTVSGNMVGTITTVAQPNITSVGTLTGLATSGNVGIGSSADTNARLLLTDNHTTAVTNSSTLLANTTLAINGNQSQGSDNLRIGPIASAGSYFMEVTNSAANGAYALCLNPINKGNVGIGTTSPSAPLHIVGEGNTGQRVHVGSSSAHQIYLGNTGGTSSVGTLSNHDFQLIRNGATKLTANSNGLALNSTTVSGNPANAKFIVNSSSQYDGIALGTGASSAVIGRHSNGAGMHLTANSAPANMGGGRPTAFQFSSGTSGGSSPTNIASLTTDGIMQVNNQPFFHGGRQGTTGSTSGWTDAAGGLIIPFNVTQDNTGSHMNTSNGEFTCPVTGQYFISFWGFLHANDSSANRIVYFRINSSDIVFNYFAHETGFNTGVGYSAVIRAAATNIITIRLNAGRWYSADWRYLGCSIYLLG